MRISTILPGHVTSRVQAEETMPLRAIMRERMSGNLCRCGASNGIVDAITEVYAGGGGMNPFTYNHAGDARSASSGAASAPSIWEAAPIWLI